MLRVAAKRLSSLSSSPWRANHAASAVLSQSPVAPSLSSEERRSDPFSLRPEFFLPVRG